MSEPFVGEIRIVGFNFPPVGWAECAGQILSTSQNTALFSLLGTAFGGNGSTTFALPDMRGRLGLGQGQGPGLSSYFMGEAGGQESHTLSISEMPQHNHDMRGTSSTATTHDPHHGVYARTLSANGAPEHLYAGSNTDLAEPMLLPAGSSLPHENRQPYLALMIIIALQGIYPARS